MRCETVTAGPVHPVPTLSTAPTPTEAQEREELAEPTPHHDRPWHTIVWNDPVNLMSYVTYVFQTYFGYSRDKAERLMRQVHEQGRSVVSHGTRERMEVDVQAMHSYGLWATLGRDED